MLTEGCFPETECGWVLEFRSNDRCFAGNHDWVAMYKNFFGLRENPFNTNPDPRFLYVTPQVQEAREELIYGVQNRKGLILLTGEVGTGKTTLINYLLDWLHQQQMPSAFIFNSHLSVNHLFDFILTDFGIPVEPGLKSNMLLLLNQWLMERLRAGRTPVLIVDEAQGLSFELLEEIRLLLNLETASEKLLQIVLVGQPELEDKLKRPEMKQLLQRIALRCNTAPLTLEESHAYIANRLRIGGATGDPIFESDAVEAVHFYSRGIPRVMNLLCEHSLINAFVEQLNPVPAPMVDEAAREFWMDEVRPVTQHSGLWNQNNNSFGLRHSIFANELISPDELAETSLPQSHQITLTPTTAAFAVGEPEFVERDTSATDVPQLIADTAPREDLDLSIALNDLTPSPQAFESRQTKTGLGWESESSRADAVAEFIAELKRNLEAGSHNPKLHLMSPNGGKEGSSPASRTQITDSNQRVFSLDIMNRLPSSPVRMKNYGLLSFLEAWGIPWESVDSKVMAPASWASMSAGVIAKFRKSICSCQVMLRQWRFEFESDWTAMTHAIAFSQTNKSLLHWLRQPVSSKPKNSI
jgi:general secretion pathway protein A